jgi:hypothetical protein
MFVFYLLVCHVLFEGLPSSDVTAVIEVMAAVP